jgi:hypothetical protein
MLWYRSVVKPVSPANVRGRIASAFSHVRLDDLETISEVLPPLTGHVEMAGADICRQKLLVEIEGVVNLDAVREGRQDPAEQA